MTLLTKVYNGSQLVQARQLLKSTLKGLRVEGEIVGTSERGWIQATISGEDEKVALRYLEEKVGFCPTSLEQIEKYATLKGRIASLKKSQSELLVDIGLPPNDVSVSVPLHHLQAQLADGRKMALRKIVELYGFCENLPLTIRVNNVEKDKKRLGAALSEGQLALYDFWLESLLQRLVVLGASFREVQLALKIRGCSRDVLGIEALGWFEYVVTCKLGTDAAGLIPKIGKNLRNATFSIFNPKRILEVLKE